MRCLLLVLLLCATARAETRLDLHVAGGLEGGTIQHVPRPDALVEIGLGAAYMLPGKNWGFGVAVENVERLSIRTEPLHELKIDALVRFKAKTRPFRWGIGAGVRYMTFEGGERHPSSTVRGLDWIRIVGAGTIASWASGGSRVGIDFFFSWTMGCYSGDIVTAPSGDMAPPTLTVRCAQAMTSSYVVGLQTSLTWR